MEDLFSVSLVYISHAARDGKPEVLVQDIIIAFAGGSAVMGSCYAVMFLASQWQMWISRAAPLLEAAGSKT